MRTLSVSRIAQPIPVIGQGTWEMGNSRHTREAEAAALRHGLDLGMTLIDTAEMYAGGGAEEVVAMALRGATRAFIVSKVLPSNASRGGVRRACEASLKRLKIEALDLYLLHWPAEHPLEDTLATFEDLRAAGKVRHWGVSNFDIELMQEVEGLQPGRCACNQVLYNLQHRGIEFDLLPWCVEQGILVQAYSPLNQGALRQSDALKSVAARHGATPEQVALAWCVRLAGVQAIPKSAHPARVEQNAAAAQLELRPEDLAELDAVYPPPRGPSPLDTA